MAETSEVRRAGCNPETQLVNCEAHAIAIQLVQANDVIIVVFPN